MAKLRAGILLLFCAIAVSAPAQIFTTLADFDGANGSNPYLMSLVQGLDGNLYGTTDEGGANSECSLGCGTVFKMAPSGALVTIYNFCSLSKCADGSLPTAGLVLATDGYLYGTTSQGGANGSGTVFRISPGGALTTLYSFCSQSGCADGGYPVAPLTQAPNGGFYGATSAFGTSVGGTIFKITPDGALTTLHDFNSTDGSTPNGGLVLATDGSFYGTTNAGGNGKCNSGGGCGTVFRITPGGELTTLHKFDLTDGANPRAGLVQGTDGNFYGTTEVGGPGICSSGSGCGTVFKMTPSGALTVLNVFDSSEGDLLYAGLVQATDGNLYGATARDGPANGTIFMITLDGVLSTVVRLGRTDSADPEGALLQATNGRFYGATTAGGSGENGTVFSLIVGLRPFVETLPALEVVGGRVIILGHNLTGSTAVSFNGTAATFTVISDTEITATVPAGATSGLVTVTTPNSTLTSNKMFQVIP